MLPTSVQKILARQEYHLVGEHAAVKQCEWTHHALVQREGCYKNKFYGIQSHRCMQCTPFLQCFNSCVFCWRLMPEAHLEKNALAQKIKWLKPRELVEKMLAEQKRIVSGYGGNPLVEKKLWEEAKNPKHVALSLVGEPILYPMLPELIKEFHSRKTTTFLVTNGIYPAQSRKLIQENTLPTQFYVSLSAWDETSYKKICNPVVAGAWNNFLETLSLMKKMKTRTVLRTTLIKGLNMNNFAEYAELVEESDANYIEAKGYMAVGFSRERLGPEKMPAHQEVKDFAAALAQETGYILSEEHEKSRAVLLCRDEKALENRLIKQMDRKEGGDPE
jgi:tRNA wybutosine-synthesizing protein 1